MKRLVNLFKIGWSANKVRLSQSEAEQLLARQALVRMLADARGVSMKIGQLFADVEGNSDYQTLVEGIEPFPLKQMLPVLQKGLKKPVKKVFKSIDEAISAASLGQVHFALLKTGEKVAVKLRYPDIAEAIDTELRVAGLLPGMGPVKQWGFELEAYKSSLRNNMQRELNYRSEAERQDYFSQVVKIDGLNVPYVYKELCSESVLVQSRASGVLINEVSGWPIYDREKIGEILLKTLFKSLFVAGEVHGDPHAGNVFYDYDKDGSPVVSLLDYGCTIHISEQRRLALLKLIVACRIQQAVSPLDCFVAIGFDVDKLAHINGSLPLLCQYLFQPFLSGHAFKLSEWELEKNMTDLLGEKRWWFRSAGPADLLLLMRAFQGLVVQLQFLKVSLNWWDILQQAVGDNLIQQAAKYELPVAGIKEQPRLCFADQASKLCVQVRNNGKLTVSVTLPAEAVLDLEQIMPEDVAELLKKSDVIDLKKILEDLRDHGLKPQVLFQLGNASKQYKVWLE